MVLLSLHDITTIKRSEQQRADFVANASHELRTPLASLTGFIETLRGPARDDVPARERFLGIMHDQASRMARLVDDLLSLSRIELDEHTPPSQRVDMVRCVRAVIAALELKAAARRVRLRLVAAEAVPTVAGDGDQLTQVMQNLISNAVKYTREQTEITITLESVEAPAAGAALVPAAAGRRPPRPMVAITVADQGEGIERIHLPRLTERFYRVDPARSRALGGTGLGLAIVKHIINRHRGRLTIDSEPGRGSTFTVTLPVAPG
jgi:two-component system phosphate regulon sensor histidine kinase PhoR